MSSDELDIEQRPALQSYLQSRFSPQGEFEIIEFEVLAGGVSSRTVRVKLRGGQEWVLKQALAKLRVKADWFSDPRRVHREALGMRALGELTPPGSVPKLIFDDETHHVLAMEAVPQPHENWKARMLAGRADAHFAAYFGSLLGQIHRGSAERSGELAHQFADRSFFESLRLEPYYSYSAVQEPRAAAFYERLIAETRATTTALVHGDYSPKNVLIVDGRTLSERVTTTSRIVSEGEFEVHCEPKPGPFPLVLLDHEVCHWGDPAFDVGFALTHFLSKAHHRPQIRSAFVGMATMFHSIYAACFTPDATPPSAAGRVRHTLGCLLARVVGRSPLEYLSSVERERQREAVVRLILDEPRDIPELIKRFVKEIESRE